MGIKFLQNIDAERNKLEEAGFEEVNALPTTNLFAGRQVTYNGQLYVYNGSQWVNVNAPYEANLQWGGRNINQGFSPIDAALNSSLRANRFAFYHTQDIILDYSIDGGANWSNYELDDDLKIKSSYDDYTPLLVLTKHIDKETATSVDWRLRATFRSNNSIDTELNKFMINVRTYWTTDCWVTVSVVNHDDTISTLIDHQRISGWPHWNVLNLKSKIRIGSNNTYCVKSISFTFGGTHTGSDSGLTIYTIRGYGSPWYSFANKIPLAKNDVMYSIDPNGDVNFPARVKSVETVNFDVDIKPTQTGTVAKTSDWLWQYYAQSIAWLMANHLPLAGGTMTGNLTVPKLIKTGGAATQMLMADGSTKDVSGFAASGDIPEKLPNPNPIIIKTADGVSVRYDGSTSGGVILEAGDNAELTATQDSEDTMTVKFGAIVPTKLPNPQAMTIQVLDDEGALLGSDIQYDGLTAKILKLIAGYGIELTNSNLSNGQAVAINLKQIAGTTLLGNKHGGTGTPAAITMNELRSMLGSLTINSLSIMLGGNSTYVLPCYMELGGSYYQVRLSNNALQIYRNGVWAEYGRFCQCSASGGVTAGNLTDWFSPGTLNYAFDGDVSKMVFITDIRDKGFGTKMSATWSGEKTTLNLEFVNISDTKSAWEIMKENLRSCFPEGVAKVRFAYNVAIPSGEVKTRIEMSYKGDVGVVTTTFYTEG